MLRYSAWEYTGIGGLSVSVVRCLVTSCGDAYNDTTPRAGCWVDWWWWLEYLRVSRRAH